MGLAGYVSNHLTARMHEAPFSKTPLISNELNLHTRVSEPIGRNRSLTSCHNNGHDLRAECFESREGCCTGRDVPSSVLFDMHDSNNVQMCTQYTCPSRAEFCSTLVSMWSFFKQAQNINSLHARLYYISEQQQLT